VLAHQAAYAASQADRVGLIAGRGAGKTWGGAYRLLMRAATDPGDYAVVAPTFANLEDYDWPAVLSVANAMRLRLTERKAAMKIILPAAGADGIPTTSEIKFRSAERPDRLRGLNLKGLWIDEGRFVAKEAVDILLFTLREGSNPWVGVTTTPKGRRNWVYDWFGASRPGTELIRAKTRDNVLLAEKVQQRFEADAVGSWALQELGGEWVDPEGTEWPAEHWGDWVMVSECPIPRLQRRVIAVDPSLGAKTDSGDYSAIVCLGTADGLLWVEADLARRPPHQLIADTLQIADRWKPHAIGVEAVAFQSLLVNEIARQRRVPWPLFGIKADGPKELRIRRLGPAIVRRELRIADTPGGRLLYRQLRDWPESDHDDGPDALEMALRLLTEMR
jgi:phage terminase large subunit-like protein